MTISKIINTLKMSGVNSKKQVIDMLENASENDLEPHTGNPYAALHRSKSLSEVERLRLMVAKLEVENARLKKGYWVEGVGANKEYVTGKGKTTKSSKNSE